MLNTLHSLFCTKKVNFFVKLLQIWNFVLQNGGISSRNLLQIWVYLLQKQNFPAPQIARISILAVAPLAGSESLVRKEKIL